MSRITFIDRLASLSGSDPKEQHSLKVAEMHRQAKLEPICENARRELLESEALLKGHFKLNQNCHSDLYVNPHALFYESSRMWRLNQLLFEAMATSISFDDIDMIVGPESGGALMAHAIAGMVSGSRVPGRPTVHFGKISKDPDSGTGYSVKKFYADKMGGQRILLVDDVVDSGITLDNAMVEIKSVGGLITAVAVVVDRGRCKFPWASRVHALYKAPASHYYRLDDCPMCREGMEITKF